MKVPRRTRKSYVYEYVTPSTPSTWGQKKKKAVRERKFNMTALPPNFISRMANLLIKNNTVSFVKAVPSSVRAIQPRLNVLKPKYTRDNIEKMRRYEIALMTGLNTNIANNYYANFPNSINHYNQYQKVFGKYALMYGSGYYKQLANNMRPTAQALARQGTNTRNLRWVKMPKNWRPYVGKQKETLHWLAHSANGKTQYKFFPYKTQKGTLTISKNGTTQHHRNALNTYVFPTYVNF